MLKGGFLVKFGSVSFEFYMIHQLIIRYLGMVFDFSNYNSLQMLAFSITALTFSLVISFLISSLFKTIQLSHTKQRPI